MAGYLPHSDKLWYANAVKLLILYRPNAEHATTVESFIRDLLRQHENVAQHLEVLSLNTREGVAMASLYDIVSSPAIVALASDGAVLKLWQGMPLPLMNEVAGYVYAVD